MPIAKLLAGAFKIPVSLLNVFDSVLSQFANPDRGLFYAQSATSYRDNAVDYLETAGADLKSSGVTLNCTAHGSNPAEQIIGQAEGDSNILIAMVTHGRSGLGR